MEKPIIEIKNVSMRFNLATERTDTMKEYILKLLKRQLMFQEFYALEDVNLTINRGEAVALIGRNGSGKSTLLKCIAGVLYPTTGTISVKGSIAPLIELGAGFDPDLTARENIYLNGAVLGHDRKFMDEHFKSIVDFAELWDFIDVPIKNFSSGMVARLGFSIATIVEADLLIVDEILAVGDYKFQEKCYSKMTDMLSKGATLIFVSHDIDTVRNLCNKAVWLNHGVIQSIGEVNSVCNDYCAYMDSGKESTYLANTENINSDAQNEDAVIPKENFFCGKRLQLYMLTALIILGYTYWSSNQYPEWYGSRWCIDLLVRPLNLAWNGTWLALLMLMMGSGAMTAACFGERKGTILSAVGKILKWFYLPIVAVSVLWALLYGVSSLVIPNLGEGIISPMNSFSSITLLGVLTGKAYPVWCFNEFGNYLISSVLANLFFVLCDQKTRKLYPATSAGVMIILLLLGKVPSLFPIIQPVWFLGVVFAGQVLFITGAGNISIRYKLIYGTTWYLILLNCQRSFLWDSSEGSESLMTSLILSVLFLLIVLSLDIMNDRSATVVKPWYVCCGAAWWTSVAVGGKMIFSVFWRLNWNPPFILKFSIAAILVSSFSIGFVIVGKHIRDLLIKGKYR